MSSKLQAAVPRLAATILLLARNPQHAISKQQPATGDNASPENDIHVLMMKRHSRARFMPNVYVFPGGGIEGADYATAEHYLEEHYGWKRRDAKDKKRATQRFLESNAQSTAEEAEVRAWACRVGALRELAEEAACVFRRDSCICSEAQWIAWQKLRDDASALRATSTGSASSLATSPPRIYDLSAILSLRPVARWVSPRQLKYRYDTYFYAALVNAALISTEAGEAARASRCTGTFSGDAANACEAIRRISPQELPLLQQTSEVSDLLWVSPRAALRRHEDPSDTFSLAPPTYLMLHALSLQPSFASMVTAWAASPPSSPDGAGQLLGKLPYSSVLPPVEPLSSMAENGQRIIDLVLPSRYFHETGWSVADGEYLFPDDNVAADTRFIHLFVGSAGAAKRDGPTAGKAHRLVH
ncbi:hypothetical protein LSCM1_06383 [Leishmania martiniquensis]|uniref:Nudix hydrolase domain-containing protein n=1 Tax=Leishmania martiniquensis TaxID=1580590 RepID=A0A836GVN5_9TRYP|nr:hypothetical protein LSCM1_06383 [Leishmania martiniquensis]